MFLKEALEKLGNDIQVNAERIDKVENLKPGHTLCPNPNPLANPAPKTKRSKRRSAYLEKPRLLVIGDPTVHNVDYAAIEKATNTRITTKEATFVHKNADNVTSAALEKANNLTLPNKCETTATEPGITKTQTAVEQIFNCEETSRGKEEDLN